MRPALALLGIPVLLLTACASRSPAEAPDESSTARTVTGTWQGAGARSTWTATFEAEALTAIEEKLVGPGDERSTGTYAFQDGRLVRYASLGRRPGAGEVVTRILFGPDGQPAESTRTVDGRDEPVDVEAARAVGAHAEELAALAQGEGTGTTLTGRLSWDASPGPLPEGAVAAVRVEDVTGGEAGVTLAETTVQVGGRLPPIPFELPYDRARLRPGRHYGLTVHVEKDGEVLLTNERHVPVLGGGSDPVDVALSPPQRR